MSKFFCRPNAQLCVKALMPRRENLQLTSYQIKLLVDRGKGVYNLSTIVINHSLHGPKVTSTFHEVRKLERFQTAKVTFKVIQGYWQRCYSNNSIGHIRFPISVPLQLSLSCSVNEILSLTTQI